MRMSILELLDCSRKRKWFESTLIGSFVCSMAICLPLGVLMLFKAMGFDSHWGWLNLAHVWAGWAFLCCASIPFWANLSLKYEEEQLGYISSKLAQCDKNDLIVLSRSEELSEEQKSIVVGFLNKHHKGWSLPCQTVDISRSDEPLENPQKQGEKLVLTVAKRGSNEG